MNAPPLNDREVLLRLLIGDSDVASSAVEAVERNDSWQEVIELAFQWKALPELSDQLSRLGIVPPGEARNDLRILSREAFLRSTMIATRGAEALHAIASEGIPVAAFKGLALVAVAGAERGRRTLQDVDLLVAEVDVISAVGALERRGYRRGFPGDLRDYFRFVRNSPGFSGNQAVLLTAPDGGDVDLHWRVGPRKSAAFESQSLLARALCVELRGRTVSVIGSIDGALLTVHHSLRNNFVPDEMIRDLLDLSAWLIQLEDDGQLIAFAEAAQDCSLHGPAFAMTGVLRALRPSEAASRATSELQKEMASSVLSQARKLEKLFFLQLSDGPLNSDMLYLLSRDAWKLILGGALGGWGRYREHMAAFEKRKHGAVLPVSRRAALLWHDTVRAKRSHWSALRTLVRAKV